MNKIIRLRFRHQLAQEWNRSSAAHKLRVALWSFAAGLLMLGVLFLTGCVPGGGGTNPWLTPAAITGDVRDTVQLGLVVYPKAKEEVAIARDVICNAAGNTNFSSAVILDSLEKAGITNSNSKIIVNGVLFIWNRVEPLVGTNVHIYAEAVCLGMREGTGVNLSAAKSAKPLPPHLK